MEWVLRRTSVAEVASRLKKEKEERERDAETEYDGRSGGARKLNLANGGAWGSISAGRGGGGEPADRKNPGGGLLADQDTAGAAADPSAPPPSTAAAAISEAAAAAAAALAPPEPGGIGGDDTGRGVSPSIPVASAVGQRQHRADHNHDDGTDEEEEDDGEEDDVADRLAGIFEFLRSGNSLLLPPDLRDDWESRPDLGLGLLSADDHQDDLVRRYHARSLSSRPATAAGAIDSSPAGAGEGIQQAPVGVKNNMGSSGKGGGLSFNFTGGSGKGVSTWARGLCKEANSGDGGPMTYHDLRMALTATAPRGRRSETTNDKLERRLVERRNRADQMAASLWGNDRPGFAENLYAPPVEVSSSWENDKFPG